MNEELKTALDKYGITEDYIQQKIWETDVGYIYVIRCNDYYKIGRTFKDVHHRLDSMQVGNPYNLEIMLSVWVHKCREVEIMLHKVMKMQGRHIRGEWFEFEVSTIKDIKEILKDYE